MNLRLGTSAIWLRSLPWKTWSFGGDGEMAGIREIHITLPAKNRETVVEPLGRNKGPWNWPLSFMIPLHKTSTPSPIMERWMLWCQRTESPSFRGRFCWNCSFRFNDSLTRWFDPICKFIAINQTCIWTHKQFTQNTRIPQKPLALLLTILLSFVSGVR